MAGPFCASVGAVCLMAGLTRPAQLEAVSLMPDNFFTPG
jgi:hypothetical protein